MLEVRDVAARYGDVQVLWGTSLEVRAGSGSQLAGTVSGGPQQMLAIGRAVMGLPRLLLLDEPSLGLAPVVVQQIFGVIESITQERGVTVLLVEQNARLALEIAQRA